MKWIIFVLLLTSCAAKSTIAKNCVANGTYGADILYDCEHVNLNSR